MIGVTINNVSKAYDWNKLLKEKIIEDTIRNNVLLLTIAADKKTAYAFNRKINNQIYNFYVDNNILTDVQTHSQWLSNGMCISGLLKGMRLQMIQSYQEFWHSWQTFHPQTEKYSDNK